ELLVRRGQTGSGGADDGPDVLELAEDLRIAQTRPPTGDGLELVERAPGVAEPAAGQLRDGDVEDCDQRTRGRVILSPTPPVECLSEVGRDSDEKSIRSPEAIIACVQSAISDASMSLMKIAM